MVAVEAVGVRRERMKTEESMLWKHLNLEIRMRMRTKEIKTDKQKQNKKTTAV